MRMDQFVGLNPQAVAFLEEKEVPQKVCECCNCLYPRNLEIIGNYEGMFGAKYPLNRHQLQDGTYADEFLQAAPWSSGPMFFLGLRLQDGTEFKWSDTEVGEI